MSKRTDILKLRVTPEFKARVLREAAYRQVSLTELTETALENEMRGAATPPAPVSLNPIVTASDPVAPPATIDPSAFSAQPVGAPDSTFSGQKVQTPVPVAIPVPESYVVSSSGVTRAQKKPTMIIGNPTAASPQPDAVSTSGEVGAKAVPKSNCTHDHPLWQFCLKCYEARVTR